MLMSQKSFTTKLNASIKLAVTAFLKILLSNTGIIGVLISYFGLSLDS